MLCLHEHAGGPCLPNQCFSDPRAPPSCQGCATYVLYELACCKHGMCCLPGLCQSRQAVGAGHGLWPACCPARQSCAALRIRRPHACQCVHAPNPRMCACARAHPCTHAHTHASVLPTHSKPGPLMKPCRICSSSTAASPSAAMMASICACSTTMRFFYSFGRGRKLEERRGSTRLDSPGACKHSMHDCAEAHQLPAHVPYLEELVQQGPVLLLPAHASHVLKRVHLHVSWVVPRQDLRVEEAIGEVPVAGTCTTANASLLEDQPRAKQPRTF